MYSKTDANGASFLEQRKAHYDEFLKVKEHRRKGSMHEEEDENHEETSSTLTSGVKDIEIEEGSTNGADKPRVWSHLHFELSDCSDK